MELSFCGGQGRLALYQKGLAGKIVSRALLRDDSVLRPVDVNPFTNPAAHSLRSSNSGDLDVVFRSAAASCTMLAILLFHVRTPNPIRIGLHKARLDSLRRPSLSVLPKLMSVELSHKLTNLQQMLALLDLCKSIRSPLRNSVLKSPDFANMRKSDLSNHLVEFKSR